jgi:hypothetical protein
VNVCPSGATHEIVPLTDRASFSAPMFFNSAVSCLEMPSLVSKAIAKKWQISGNYF